MDKIPPSHDPPEVALAVVATGLELGFDVVMGSELALVEPELELAVVATGLELAPGVVTESELVLAEPELELEPMAVLALELDAEPVDTESLVLAAVVCTAEVDATGVLELEEDDTVLHAKSRSMPTSPRPAAHDVVGAAADDEDALVALGVVEEELLAVEGALLDVEAELLAGVAVVASDVGLGVEETEGEELEAAGVELDAAADELEAVAVELEADAAELDADVLVEAAELEDESLDVALVDVALAELDGSNPLIERI